MLFSIKVYGEIKVVNTRYLIDLERNNVDYEWLGFATDKNWQCGTEPKGETTVCLG